MKKLTISLLTSMAVAATSFAGTEISSGKDKKTVVPTTCFNDHELQLDVYGTYTVGEGPSHAGPVHDHAWGGGIGVNYFFTRYIGIGAEGMWDTGADNGAVFNDDHNGHHHDGDHGRTTFHHINGDLIFRLPLDQYCLAPYAFLGGGAVLDADDWAVAFAGVGVEYRVVPNKVGVFVDGRWNYFADRFDRGDQNNFTFRAGVRWVF